MGNALLEEGKEFLTRLSVSSGVSGYEAAIASLIKEQFGSVGAEVESDRFGNVYALKKGTGKLNTRIMLAAHMDEIGLMVKKIDSRGFLYFTAVGGVDPRNLFSSGSSGSRRSESAWGDWSPIPASAARSGL